MVAPNKPTTFQPCEFHHQVMCKAKPKVVSRWFDVRRCSRSYSRRWRTVNQSMQRDAIQLRDWNVWLPTWIERDRRPTNLASPCFTAICGLVVGPVPARCHSNCCSIETGTKELKTLSYLLADTIIKPARVNGASTLWWRNAGPNLALFWS